MNSLNALQLMMSWVCAGDVLSLQSSILSSYNYVLLSVWGCTAGSGTHLNDLGSKSKVPFQRRLDLQPATEQSLQGQLWRLLNCLAGLQSLLTDLEACQKVAMLSAVVTLGWSQETRRLTPATL